LTCFNTSAASSLANVTVSVGSTAGCPAPLNGTPGFTRDNEFASLAANFPSSLAYPYLQVAYNPSFTQNEYVAWSFTAQSNTHFRINSEVSNGPQEKVSMALSRCPGVFEETELGQDCHVEGTSAAPPLNIYTNDRPIFSGICYLVPGETYFLNIVWAEKNDITDMYDKDCAGTCTMLQTNAVFGSP
ncbi:MAG: hypothetical protein L3J83_06215, partial [Proteobacteria bacterium]|nr:hypothetical protein [Pseudomonadota bacterium]